MRLRIGLGPFTTPRRAAAISEINEASWLRPRSSIQMPTYCLPSGFTELHTWFYWLPFYPWRRPFAGKTRCFCCLCPILVWGQRGFHEHDRVIKEKRDLGVEEALHLQCDPAGVGGCPSSWGTPSQREPFSGSCYPPPHSLLL